MKRLRGAHVIPANSPNVAAGRLIGGTTLRHTYRAEGTHDWLLIYTLGGSGLYRFPGGEFHSSAHDVTLFRPGAFQDYQIAPDAKKWDLLYVHFLPGGPDRAVAALARESASGFMVSFSGRNRPCVAALSKGCVT